MKFKIKIIYFLFSLCIFNFVKPNYLMIKVNSEEEAKITLIRGIKIFIDSPSASNLVLDKKLKALLNGQNEEFKKSFFEKLEDNLVRKYDNCECLKVGENFCISFKAIKEIIIEIFTKNFANNTELNDTMQEIAQI